MIKTILTIIQIILSIIIIILGYKTDEKLNMLIGACLLILALL